MQEAMVCGGQADRLVSRVRSIFVVSLVWFARVSATHAELWGTCGTAVVVAPFSVPCLLLFPIPSKRSRGISIVPSLEKHT